MNTTARAQPRSAADGRIGYFADFVVYAVLLLALVVLGCAGQTGPRSAWFGAVAAGAAGWTLIEYVMHRFVFHRVPFAAAVHLVHHRAPRTYLWTPTWSSLATLAGVFFLPLWRYASLATAAGVVTGIIAGYLWYGIEHHIMHHGYPRWLWAALRAARRRHALHHRFGADGNYGVTTSLWDIVFGTTLSDRDRRRPRVPAA